MQYKADREKFILAKMDIEYLHGIQTTIYTGNKGPFSEAEYFFKMWKWARTQKWWGNFVEFMVGQDTEIIGPLYWGIEQHFIDPEAFAEALYHYLNPPPPKEE